jgi:hypothetical protein
MDWVVGIGRGGRGVLNLICCLMTRKLFIAIILFVVTLVGKLVVDLNLYFNNAVNYHIFGPAVVLIVLAACSVLSGWRSIPVWLFVWWSVFDSLYGLFIHQVFFYVGTTARLDILQRTYPWIIWLKYIGAVASVIYYIVYIKKKNYVRN